MDALGSAIPTSSRTGSAAPGIASPGYVLSSAAALSRPSAVGPHGLDVGLYVLEPLRARLIPAARTVAPLADEAGRQQDAQMLRDRLAGDVEASGDVARRALLAGQEREHLAPTRLGERLEDIGGQRVQVYTCASCFLPI